MIIRQRSWSIVSAIVALLLLCTGCASHFNPKVSPRPVSYQLAPAADEHRMLETRDKDRLMLFGQWWLPDGPQEPQAVILILHGTLVHSGFYDLVSAHYANQGYAVFGIDFRGWGQSQGYGRRGNVDDYDGYLEDLKVAYEEVRQRYPSLPVYLQGESMGGTIALLSQVEKTVEVDGLILNAPAVRPGLFIGPLRTPHWLADAGLWGISIPGAMAPNMPTPVYMPWVKRSAVGLMLKEKENKQRFLNDPFVPDTALPWGYFTALRDAMKRVKAGLDQIDVPVLIQHGTKDVLVPVSSSEFTMKRLASDDKQLKIYDKLTHGTLHDRRREEVWADALNWLAQQRSAESRLTAR